MLMRDKRCRWVEGMRNDQGRNTHQECKKLLQFFMNKLGPRGEDEGGRQLEAEEEDS